MECVHPLKNYRTNQSPPLKQEGLASLLGVSKATVSRWETGARKPDEKLLSLIREKTGIAPRELRPDLAEAMSEAAE